MEINKSTFCNWIKKWKEKIQKTDIVDKENKSTKSKTVEEIEMDKLFAYIKDKKTEHT